MARDIVSMIAFRKAGHSLVESYSSIHKAEIADIVKLAQDFEKIYQNLVYYYTFANGCVEDNGDVALISQHLGEIYMMFKTQAEGLSDDDKVLCGQLISKLASFEASTFDVANKMDEEDIIRAIDWNTIKADLDRLRILVPELNGFDANGVKHEIEMVFTEFKPERGWDNVENWIDSEDYRPEFDKIINECRRGKDFYNISDRDIDRAMDNLFTQWFHTPEGKEYISNLYGSTRSSKTIDLLYMTQGDKLAARSAWESEFGDKYRTALSRLCFTAKEKFDEYSRKYQREHEAIPDDIQNLLSTIS